MIDGQIEAGFHGPEQEATPNKDRLSQIIETAQRAPIEALNIIRGALDIPVRLQQEVRWQQEASGLLDQVQTAFANDPPISIDKGRAGEKTYHTSQSIKLPDGSHLTLTGELPNEYHTTTHSILRGLDHAYVIEKGPSRYILEHHHQDDAEHPRTNNVDRYAWTVTPRRFRPPRVELSAANIATPIIDEAVTEVWAVGVLAGLGVKTEPIDRAQIPEKLASLLSQIPSEIATP